MTIKPLQIGCIGEAMLELQFGKDSLGADLGIAGDVLNTAIYMRRCLPPEHVVSFVSVIGNDPLSNQMANYFAGEGLSLDHLARHEERVPGIYGITTDDQGERSFLYWRDNSAAKTMFSKGSAISAQLFQHFDVVYFSAITLAIISTEARTTFMDALKEFQKNGGLVAFDSNYRPNLWPDVQSARDAVEDVWKNCDIALPSIDDEMELFSDPDEASVLARFAEYGVSVGALKRGGDGPLPIGSHDVPATNYRQVLDVVDTTAAGDSFVGAFLASHLMGEPLHASLQAGHECAAKVISHRGAIVAKEVWK